MKTILLQLDTDEQPSVFDAVVAADAGVDVLLRHGGVRPEGVRDLVHGALFTRGPADLKSTAIFVGGSDVAAAESVLKAVKAAFFGPFRVSVLFDANGCNTTAAAAVLAAIDGASRTLGAIDGADVAVLAATGPVGQRVARLLLGLGKDVKVRVGSRRLDRAKATAALLAAGGHAPTPFATADEADLARGIAGANLVIAAGAAGARLLPKSVLGDSSVKVAIDLNAVPPAGIEGIEATDRGVDRDGVLAWGALGVGRTKMKIHKKAIAELFAAYDRVMDAEEALELGKGLG